MTLSILDAYGSAASHAAQELARAWPPDPGLAPGSGLPLSAELARLTALPAAATERHPALQLTVHDVRLLKVRRRVPAFSHLPKWVYGAITILPASAVSSQGRTHTLSPGLLAELTVYALADLLQISVREFEYALRNEDDDLHSGYQTIEG